MKHLQRCTWACAACLSLSGLMGVQASARTAGRNVKPGQDKQEDRRPKLKLKAQPIISMSPSRVVLTAELVGGADDFEDYYCPTVEWDWGDGTQSESTLDCAPYEPGKSEIRRHFTVEHVFRTGAYHVMFKLKRRDKAVGAASVSIQVRPGLQDISQ